MSDLPVQSAETPAGPRLVVVAPRPGMVERSRAVWFDARRVTSKDDPRMLAVQNSGIDTLLVRSDHLQEFGGIGSRVRLVAFVEDRDALDCVPRSGLVAAESAEVLQAAAEQGHGTALLATIGDAQALARTLEVAPRFTHLIVRLIEPTNIPLELVIARLRGRGVALMKEVVSSEDAAIAFETLETGSDGVLVTTDDIRELSQLQIAQRKYERGQLQLVSASVVRTQYIGMGHRACVDTIGLMSNQEGFLVGSTSAGGFLACSETHPLPYMNLRPFRVNAGAVHSYIWGPDDLVEYLSDLKVASRVLCVDTTGGTRALAVGRVKIEVRPLLLVEAVYEDTLLNAIVQDDWHIRLFRADGQACSVTALRTGDALLAHVTEPGRHVGIFVKETIIER